MPALVPSQRPSFGLAPLPTMRFSVELYHRLTALGILTEDHDVELLEGWIVPKMARNPPHDYSLSKIHRQIEAVVPSNRYIRNQMAITTGDSEPEPDLTVVVGNEDRYADRHPGPADIGLLIEISDTTLGRDRREKLALYARARIGCYWIVNLPDRQVEVYTQPESSEEAPSYGLTRTFRAGESVPVEIGGTVCGTIPVNELFPRGES